MVSNNNDQLDEELRQHHNHNSYRNNNNNNHRSFNVTDDHGGDDDGASGGILSSEFSTSKTRDIDHNEDEDEGSLSASQAYLQPSSMVTGGGGNSMISRHGSVSGNGNNGGGIGVGHTSSSSHHHHHHRGPINGSIASDNQFEMESDAGSATYVAPGQEKREARSEIEHLSVRETQRVQAWRMIVLSSILIAGALVSTGAYLFLKHEEEDDYVSSYNLFTHTISDASELQYQNMLNSIRSVSETITGAANTGNQTFPYVTVPLFEVEGKHARIQSGFEIFIYCPLVTIEQRATWNEYSVNHQYWIEQSRNVVLMGGDGTVLEQTYADGLIIPYIWKRDSEWNAIEPPGPGPFAPFWHTSPPPYNPASLPNYNALNDGFATRMLHVAVAVRDAIMTEHLPFARLAGTLVNPEDHRDYHLEFVEDVNGETAYDHPHSAMMQPVYEQLQDRNSKVVGFIWGVLPWDKFLANLLPQTIDGIYIVLKNTCGQSFTYVVLGNKARYLGQGDFHDPKYSDTEQFVQVSQYANPDTVDASGHCVYSFHMYSSDEFRGNSQTDLPIISTFFVALTFILMALVFFMYDAFVRKRNAVVLDAAARSNAILSSLFPTNIRERLFADKENEDAMAGVSGIGGGFHGGGGIGGRNGFGGNGAGTAPKSQLKSFLASGEFFDGSGQGDAGVDDDDVDAIIFKSKPIADLFPETTILFADIAGFTAWSSVREPSQVFILLETLYHAFDELAKKRRVFKVETVGDCYVAVTGLPDPQKDHAVVMARFARECLFKTRHLTKRLEVTLGPDTGDLAMRMGLHSGPVTAGVLRGERSRFQLFGDTMNTAARMEQTGIRDRIQVSQETADILCGAGKDNWIKKREEKVVAKGKGEMQTYWLLLGSSRSDAGTGETSTDSSDTERNGELLDDYLDGHSYDHMDESGQGLHNGAMTIDARTGNTPGGPLSIHGGINVSSGQSVNGEIYDGKTARLIDWNVDVLIRLLKQIVSRRILLPKGGGGGIGVDGPNNTSPNEGRYKDKGRPVMDEVKEIITLPKFNARMYHNSIGKDVSLDPEHVELDQEVIEQLHDFVCNIAALYRDNPFHSFEHASHVTMSVVKLLSRIVAPTDIDFHDTDDVNKQNIASTLHDHTYGITSDPLTQFACVFSALIHDADHTGVPNSQLVKENTKIATYYKNKSVAEQNSVDLAWSLLMDDNYVDLRAVIYTTDAELRRFRQLVVNSVMATDIVDKELKTLRNLRWDRAFSDNAANTTVMEGSEVVAAVATVHHHHHHHSSRDDINRKATIVIEHLIQASDVAHTMQHWHIYRKWNERFFIECYQAWRAGRAEKDPTTVWYQGELGFFDFYIIPLAKKLKDCGVFGVASDEYLNYAVRNRQEWEERGRDVVDEMIELVQQQELRNQRKNNSNNNTTNMKVTGTTGDNNNNNNTGGNNGNNNNNNTSNSSIVRPHPNRNNSKASLGTNSAADPEQKPSAK